MNTRPVILYNSPRPVNHLLVPFNLRDDFLLYFQRRQGDFNISQAAS